MFVGKLFISWSLFSEDLFGYIPGISEPKPCDLRTLQGQMYKITDLTRNAGL